ncbi:hypothetical protein A9Q88_01355 [Gammaproteobacteria bacterium 50_400_T64]|nr:hypothetical protein A9Q88_01355 [Gammaproteobacteria bacterium 50_400_T64]
MDASLENKNTHVILNRQRLFIKYVLAILVDLTVLNLFDQYWDHVHIESFSVSLLAAALLQFLLQLTIALEHNVAEYFKKKDGLKHRIARGLSTWAILFISKLVILQAINFSFGDSVLFTGHVHGLIAFIIVIIAMVIAEQSVTKVYRTLA